MSLCTELQMIELLGCSKAQFDSYLERNVFAPAVRDKKRGRPPKNNPNAGAIYESETVKKEVEEFETRKFTPIVGCGAISETNGSGEQIPSDSIPGKVYRFDDADERLKDSKTETFDYAKVLGPLETLKQVRAAMIKITTMNDVPVKIKKDVFHLFKMLSDERDRKQSLRRKVPIEKYEADIQKIHESWVKSWSGEAGIEAARSIIEKIEQTTGKSIRKEFSGILTTVHRAIVDVSNRVVQPNVLKIVEKL